MSKNITTTKHTLTKLIFSLGFIITYLVTAADKQMTYLALTLCCDIIYALDNKFGKFKVRDKCDKSKQQNSLKD